MQTEELARNGAGGKAAALQHKIRSANGLVSCGGLTLNTNFWFHTGLVPPSWCVLERYCCSPHLHGVGGGDGGGCGGDRVEARLGVRGGRAA